TWRGVPACGQIGADHRPVATGERLAVGRAAGRRCLDHGPARRVRVRHECRRVKPSERQPYSTSGAGETGRRGRPKSRGSESIQPLGLLCRRSKGERKAAWATLHVVERHGGRAEDVVVLESDVPGAEPGEVVLASEATSPSLAANQLAPSRLR